MDQWRRDQFEKLYRVGYMTWYSNMAMNMCAPFWWSAGRPGSAEIRGNGTICYVNTGTRHIGITADHVFEEYLKDLLKFGAENIECQFGGSTISPENRLIDRSPATALDISTFDVPVVFVTGSARTYHHNALRWPPEPLNAAEAVIHGGYPQVLRSPKTGKVEFPFQWFLTKANDADSRRIALHPDVPNVYWPGHEGNEINQRFGGQSGGPVYRVIDQNLAKGETADRMEWVGMIYNLVDVLVLARPASMINADGTINRA